MSTLLVITPVQQLMNVIVKKVMLATVLNASQFVRLAVKMVDNVLVQRSVLVHQDFKVLSAKMTLMNVLWVKMFINVLPSRHVSIRPAGKFSLFHLERFLLNWVHFRHYCECNPGFRPYKDPALADGRTICIDENECEMGTHTCHPSAQCLNTLGSFRCYCGVLDQTCSKGKVSREEGLTLEAWEYSAKSVTARDGFV